MSISTAPSALPLPPAPASRRRRLVAPGLLSSGLLLACAAGGGAEDDGSEVVQQANPARGGQAGSSSNASQPSPPGNALVGNGDGQFFEDEELDTTGQCDSILPVIVRDFHHDHPDFEMDFQGDEPRLNLVAPELGPDGKPVFVDGVGCPRDNQNHRECNPGFFPTQPVITSADSFSDWYRTIDGVNFEFEYEIELMPMGSGVYAFQSNAFFPLEPTDGFGVTPPGQGQNFLFTTEIHTLFTYVAGQQFTFQGDDDLWIFVNGRLALDLGGMHGEREATIDFDAQAAELGIVVGQDYTMDVFHAERHTSQSNFRMETNIACFTPSVVL